MIVVRLQVTEGYWRGKWECAPKIRELDVVSVIEKDVLRFDVAVDDVVGVGVR